MVAKLFTRSHAQRGTGSRSLRSRLGIAAGIAVLSLVTAACSTPAATPDPADSGAASGDVIFDGQASVGFAMYNGAVTRWYKYDVPGIEKYLAMYAPNVTFEAYDPKGNAATQQQQVNAALVKGIDFLVMTPVEVTPSAILKATKKAGVPVLLYLNPPQDVPADEVIGLVGDGDLAVGKIQAQWALDNLDKGAKVAIISGDLATVYAQRERQGVVDGLQDAFDSGDLELVDDEGAVNFDPANAQKIAASTLVANPDIDAFIVANDDMSVGVIKAIDNAGKTGDVKVIGLDGLATGAQNILNGTMSATVVRSFDDQAHAAALAIAYTLAGKDYPSDLFDGTYDFQTPEIPFVNIPFYLVTKDNLDLPIKYGNLTKEEMCDGLDPSVGGPCAS